MFRKMPPTLTAVLVTLLGITSAFALSHASDHKASAASEQLTPTKSAALQNGSTVVKKDDDEEDDDKEGRSKQEKEDEKDDSHLTASITPAEAAHFALAVQPGTAGKVTLENENGNAVYGVAITSPEGKKYDVKVDANKGSVLKSESDDEDEDEGQEAGKNKGEKED